MKKTTRADVQPPTKKTPRTKRAPCVVARPKRPSRVGARPSKEAVQNFIDHLIGALDGLPRTKEVSPGETPEVSPPRGSALTARKRSDEDLAEQRKSLKCPVCRRDLHVNADVLRMAGSVMGHRECVLTYLASLIEPPAAPDPTEKEADTKR